MQPVNAAFCALFANPSLYSGVEQRSNEGSDIYFLQPCHPILHFFVFHSLTYGSADLVVVMLPFERTNDVGNFGISRQASLSPEIKGKLYSFPNVFTTLIYLFMVINIYLFVLLFKNAFFSMLIFLTFSFVCEEFFNELFFFLILFFSPLFLFFSLFTFLFLSVFFLFPLFLFRFRFSLFPSLSIQFFLTFLILLFLFSSFLIFLINSFFISFILSLLSSFSLYFPLTSHSSLLLSFLFSSLFSLYLEFFNIQPHFPLLFILKKFCFRFFIELLFCFFYLSFFESFPFSLLSFYLLSCYPLYTSFVFFLV